MALFRRFRRDKEAEPQTAETAPTEPSPAAREPVETPPPVVPAAKPPAAPPVTVPPTAPGPERIPPPLPDRPADRSSPVSPRIDALSKCFVCGTPLEAHTCPTCRMTWVE